MARRSRPAADDLGDIEEKIIDVDVESEMQGAFLEYAYSVIYSRALPDARDGLKPVQRRILFGMTELGLRPDRAHVKCSRVVGEVMGKYHPHGDGAIYDAMVRMAQPFTMRLALVDGHGNFGSLDDGPAASRYTEARMASAALLMTGSLDEETVDFVPNYDDQLLQPEVLPAAYPNLLVNGASGIAVGMATNMAPHNLVEVIGAARHLIAHPQATLDDLMRFVPGPDLPSGGTIVGLDGIRDAYESGRGSFRTRATARIENVTPRRKGIVVTELPYLVGPEKVIEKVKQLVQAKKLQGIANINDLTDRTKGMQLVIEVKNGFNPEAVLAQLYKMTPMEESFGINNVALVAGQPRTLGLRELLTVYVEFRTDVVRRRTAYRLRRKEERLHLVEGLLVAILDIDEVIQLIRGSDDAATAKERLIAVFDLSDIQATYILDLQLRRLTKFSRIELEAERDELLAEIERLRALLQDSSLLLNLVSDELAAVAKEHGTPRRTVLLESAGGTAAAASSTPMEVADDPCWVLLSSTGLLARTTSDEPLGTGGERPSTTSSPLRSAPPREEMWGWSPPPADCCGCRRSSCRPCRRPTVPRPCPAERRWPPSSTSPPARSRWPCARSPGTAPAWPWAPGTASSSGSTPTTRATGTTSRSSRSRTVTRSSGWASCAPARRTWSSSPRAPSCCGSAPPWCVHRVVPAAAWPASSSAPVTTVVAFMAVDPSADNVVVTVAGSSGSLPGTEAGSVKVAPYAEFPAKGRATGGVRCHRFVRGEDALLLGWAGAAPARAASANGVAVALPEATGKRDGSGTPAPAPIAAVR